MTVESWEKRKVNQATEAAPTEDRVHGFYNSPSLTHLGGLGITDQPAIEGLRDIHKADAHSANELYTPLPPVVADVDVNSGWGGMGLKGNRSSGNLQRSASDASGLFIDEEDPGHRQADADETLPGALLR